MERRLSMDQELSLDAVIEQLVNLGEADPFEAARKIKKLHGAAWVAAELAGRDEELLAQMVRQVLSARRRRAEAALRLGDDAAQVDLKIAKSPVPTADGWVWKVAAQLTREDLLAKARWYAQGARSMMRRAVWCDEVAELMAAEGVRTLGKLKSPLPALPDDDAALLGPVAS